MQNFPPRIISKTFGNLNMYIYIYLSRKIFAISSQLFPSREENSPIILAIIIDLDFEIVERKEIRFNFSNNSLQFPRYDSLCYETEKTSVLRIFFFFFKKTKKKRKVNVLTISLQKRKKKKKGKKEGRGSLIVFISTWREIVHQRWYRYQHTSRVFHLGLNEQRYVTFSF